MPRTTKVSVGLELKVGKACHLTPRSFRVDAEGLQVVCVCAELEVSNPDPENIKSHPERDPELFTPRGSNRWNLIQETRRL